MLTQHDMYLLDRLARAVQRGSQMTEVQRVDLADFVEATAPSGVVRAFAQRLLDGRLSLPELVEAARTGPHVNLIAHRLGLVRPPAEPVVGILQEPVEVPRLSWWRRSLVWLARRFG